MTIFQSGDVITSAWLNAVDATISTSVVTYGAVGDGITDDTAAIQAALTAAAGGTLLIPEGVYRCDTELVGLTKTRIIGYGATIDFSQRAVVMSTQDSGLLYFRGAAAAEVLLTVDAALGDTTITVADATGLAVGDMLEVSMNAAGSFIDGSVAVKSGQLNTIVAISSLVVTLDTPIYDALGVADGARIRKITPVEDIHIEGVTFKGKGRQQPTGAGDVGLSIFHGKNVTVTNCRFIQLDQRSCNVIGTMGFTISDNYVYHDPQGANTTANYGITYSSSRGGVIRGNTCVNQRHAVVSSHLSSALTNKYYGVSRHVLVESNIVSNTWHGGIAVHNDAELIQIRGNTISGCVFGINTRDKNKEISGNTIYGCTQGVYLSGRATRTLITGNTITRCGNAMTMDKVSTGVPIVNLHITNNTISDCTSGGINCADDSPGAIMTGLLISGNTFSGVAGTGNAANIRITGSYSGLITMNVFRDSAIKGVRLDEGIAIAIVGNHFHGVAEPIDMEANPTHTIITGNVFADYGVGDPITLGNTDVTYSGNITLGTL